MRIGKLEYLKRITFKKIYTTIGLQHGSAGEGVVTVVRVAGRLADPSRMVLRSDEGMLKVDVGRMDTSGGPRGVYLTGRIGGVRLKGNGFQWRGIDGSLSESAPSNQQTPLLS